mgnify:CR=1 FL=1
MHRDREIKLIADKVINDLTALISAFRSISLRKQPEISREALRLRRHSRDHINRVIELETQEVREV